MDQDDGLNNVRSLRPRRTRAKSPSRSDKTLNRPDSALRAAMRRNAQLPAIDTPRRGARSQPTVSDAAPLAPDTFVAGYRAGLLVALELITSATNGGDDPRKAVRAELDRDDQAATDTI